MAVYPETPLPVYPVTIEPEWSTIADDADSGAEQRRQKWLFAKWNASFGYGALSAADAATLYAFYMARKGIYEPFWYFDPRPSMGMTVAHAGIYVGTGTGAATTFDLPGKSTSSRTLYVNGAVQASGFSYLTGGGDGSADRVQFTAAPALGSLITVDFTGILRMRVRFAVDRLSQELFMTVLQRFGVQLKGLSPA